MKFVWEMLTGETRRAKVIGGWIVRHNSFEETGSDVALSESMVFVPDPKHEWEITE